MYMYCVSLMAVSMMQELQAPHAAHFGTTVAAAAQSTTPDKPSFTFGAATAAGASSSNAFSFGAQPATDGSSSGDAAERSPVFSFGKQPAVQGAGSPGRVFTFAKTSASQLQDDDDL